MREIKFRAKRKDNGEWVYGNLIILGKHYFIISQQSAMDEIYDGLWFSDWHEVVSETVGQFTVEKDRKGKEIYEGDIIETTVDGLTRWTVVIFENAKFYGKKKGYSCGDSLMITNKKVVGNIFDNPELLEV